MNLVNRSLNEIKQKRKNILDGKINSIPSPFLRFKDDFIGIEQSTYYLLTSFTKGGKTQITSYMFLFYPLLWVYKNRDKCKLKIFYFPLEETPERITQRFMSFLLNLLSNGKIKVSPSDLRSSKNKALNEEIISILESEEYQEIFKFYEETVIFDSVSNPTGIYKKCKHYADENGQTFYKDSVYKDEFDQLKTTKSFDYYVANDLHEYKLIIVDHISLIDTERGMSLKQSIDKLSEYFVNLRNRYGFSPVVIQQQSAESESNDSFSLGRLRPSTVNLSDSKYTAKDCNICLGLFSPARFELKEYKGYDITKFKDKIRFLEVLVNRDGSMGGLSPLYFDGSVCQFNELPLPNDTINMNKIYDRLIGKLFFIFKYKNYGKIKY